jgi:hypothetical protein
MNGQTHSQSSVTESNEALLSHLGVPDACGRPNVPEPSIKMRRITRTSPSW